MIPLPPRHRNLLLAAAENVARNSRAYVVAASGLVVGLTLLLSGIAISEGVKAEALASVGTGADVYCTWDVFGRDGAVPRDRIDPLRTIEGVTRVVPRVIARLALEGQVAVVVGIPLSELQGHAIEVVGALPQSREEVLVGHELARALNIRPGRTIALEANSIRLFRVAGVVSSTSSLWSAKTVVCALEEATEIFGEGDSVSDVCIYTRPGYQNLVAEAVERTDWRFHVQTRAMVEAYVGRGLTIREGAFTVLYALTLALGIPSFAVMTYLGHTPRRREIGLLKAEGWRTMDVLEMVVFENLIVSIAAGALSTILAYLWVQGLRAPLIAPYFLPELPLFPRMDIPAVFLPLPAVLAVLFSIVVTMTGSVYTTWRTAITRPADMIR